MSVTCSSRLRLALCALLLPPLLAACEGAAAPEQGTGAAREPPTFEAFRSNLAFDGRTDTYIVEGDIPVVGEKALRVYYDRAAESWRLENQGQLRTTATSAVEVAPSSLVISNINNSDIKWDATTKENLTYCVSNGFDVFTKAKVVTAMQEAASAWGAVADVKFTHVPSQDSSCLETNPIVLFAVVPLPQIPGFRADSFFPNDPQSRHHLRIAPAAYDGSSLPITLRGILEHELGHILGFRHENTRVSLGRCFEDQLWRPLTTVDFGSVMFSAAACGDTPTVDLAVSADDGRGAACLYGPAPGQPAPSCGNTGVSYRGHVSDVGWLPEVWATDISGSVGQHRRYEAVQMRLQNVSGYHICYQASVAGLGWQNPVCDNALAGTTGQSRSIEAIKVTINDTPTMGTKCNVYYQAHIQDLGWTNISANGDVVGTTGQNRRLEALRVWSDSQCGFF
jgi:serralysin